ALPSESVPLSEQLLNVNARSSPIRVALQTGPPSFRSPTASVWGLWFTPLTISLCDWPMDPSWLAPHALARSRGSNGDSFASRIMAGEKQSPCRARTARIAEGSELHLPRLMGRRPWDDDHGTDPRATPGARKAILEGYRFPRTVTNPPCGSTATSTGRDRA